MRTRAHPNFVKIRESIIAKKIRHLELIEEVKKEMQNIKQVTPNTKNPDTYIPPMSPAGFAMDICLRKDAKLTLKYRKKV